MPPKAPSWWYEKQGLWPLLLTPAALVWDVVTRLRWSIARPFRSKIPVVCVGNFTAGGAGKTPAAIAIARLLLKDGVQPVFLTRGYGGTIHGPHLVDPEKDTANQVGDEPLLLARVAPVVVSAGRAAGAKLAQHQKASVIIMDDGFQNPGLEKDLSVIVIDRKMGVGNGRTIPAGPLRAGMSFQLSKADALIVAGAGDAAEPVIQRARAAGLVILEAEIVANEDTDWLLAKPLIAFSGIGHPDKFFQTLETIGCEIVGRADFPDHHTYSAADADRLLELAKRNNAQLVTTEKDFVRIRGTGSLELLKSKSRALPVRLRFKDQGEADRLLARAIRDAAL